MKLEIDSLRTVHVSYERTQLLIVRAKAQAVLGILRTQSIVAAYQRREIRYIKAKSFAVKT